MVLSHQKITISYKFLRELTENSSACPVGLRRARQHLPARISTDPEENLSLTLSMSETELEDIWWLLVTVVGCGMAMTDDCSVGPYVGAQWLAWIADHILTHDYRYTVRRGVVSIY